MIPNLNPGAVANGSAAFGRGGYGVSIHMDNVQCYGNEARLVDCSHTTNHNCFHGEDAGVMCLPRRNTIIIDNTCVFMY